MDKEEKQKVGDRLREVAEALFDGNVSALARALDMKPPSFYKYINGDRNPGTSVLVRFTHIGIDLNWLLTGEGQMLRSDSDFFTPLPIHTMGATEIDGPEEILVRVPLVRVVSGEDGDPHLKETGSPEWLPKGFIQQNYGVEPSLLKGFRVSGDAMQTSLRAGDRVRCALWDGDSLLDGAIYLLYRKPAGIIFRRIRFNGDEVLLTAENPEVPDRSVEIGNWTQSFRPIAQILECVRPL